MRKKCRKTRQTINNSGFVNTLGHLNKPKPDCPNILENTQKDYKQSMTSLSMHRITEYMKFNTQCLSPTTSFFVFVVGNFVLI